MSFFSLLLSFWCFVCFFGGRGERLLDLLCFSCLFRSSKGYDGDVVEKNDNLQLPYTFRSPSFSEFGFVGQS